MVSRLPVGLAPLALVLFLHARYDSYAVAGAVTGALSLGRRSASRSSHASWTPAAPAPCCPWRAATPRAGRHRRARPPGSRRGGLVLCGLLAGAALPPTSSVLRASWPDLLRERPTW
jgi:hypothetical protein